MKRLAIMMAFAALMTGCTQFSFQTGDTPPQSEHDKLVKAQQQALLEQEKTTLNE